MTTRRQLLKAALVSSLTALSGVSLWQLNLSETQQLVEQDDYDYQLLTLDDRLLLFAIIPVILDGALKNLDAEKTTLNLIQKIDQALDFISESSYDELRQLFDLLSHQLGRAYLAGVWSSWNQAKSIAIAEFLQEWRSSYWALLRSGYLGLHQLIMGTFYSQPESWPAIGYSGPPKLNLSEEFYQQFEL